MRFFAVKKFDTADTRARLELLEAACGVRDVEFISIDVDSIDVLNLPVMKRGDMVFQVDRGALIVERLLITSEVASFYVDYQRTHYQQWQLLNHMRDGIPMPRTVSHVVTDREILKRQVAAIGGFPVIVKVLGGTHGMGVMLVDSFESLYSVLGYVLGGNRVVLREYIPSKKHARLIVLGDEIVDSIEYSVSGDEFRTNAGDNISVKPKTFSEEVERTAINGVRSLGLEFGGVDIILGAKNHYLLEVNFPCNFVRAQEATGVDIAGKMVDFLVEKSRGM